MSEVFALERSRAAELLASAEVWDMMLPWLPVYWDFATLARYKRAGYSFLSITLQDWPPTFDGTRQCIQRFKEMAQAHADWLAFGSSLAEIDEGRREGKLVLGLNSHETRILEEDVSRIEALHALGIRHMILAYQIRNLVADGCAEGADAGLSNYGRRVVREMNRVGILVDCSHTGRRSSLDAMDLSERPVIFSHSGAYSVYPHIRNVRDDQIRACAESGGVIGVVGLGAFLGDADARAESVFRHIDHIASIAGPEHVGLGADLCKWRPVSEHVEEWEAVKSDSAFWWPNALDAWRDPTTIGGDPAVTRIFETRCFAPEQVVELVDVMLGHGYSADVVRGILGTNFRRVYATASA